MHTITKLFLSLVLGLLITLLSFTYRTDYQGVVGNLCAVTTTNPSSLCYEALPAGGFPLQYIYDRGGISVVGKLGVEDKFTTLPFIINIAIYSSLTFIVLLLYGKRKNS